MKVTGIVCEYNPFHNGHKYHIEETKRKLNPDFIIGIMSGCFTQRGTPAIVDKYSRTYTALMGGCDIVLELPVRYATHSAEGFAAGAIGTLEATGICDSLCFGSEQGNLDDMHHIATILHDEPENYLHLLSNHLKSGISYPAAREQALTDYLGTNVSFAYEPNNILAIEYIKACIGTTITPYTIKRNDSGYHVSANSQDHTTNSSAGNSSTADTFANCDYATNGSAGNSNTVDTFANCDYTTNNSASNNSPLISAEHIRNLIYSNKKNKSNGSSTVPSSSYIQNISSYVPDYTLNKLTDTVNDTDFDKIIYYSLLKNLDTLEEYIDMSKDLAQRIRNNITSFSNKDSFIKLIKTKNYTYTRIERAIIHCVLEIKNIDTAEKKYPIPYIRVLGFKKSASQAMKLLQKNATVPVITRPARDNELDNIGQLFLNEDIMAAEIYNHIRYMNTDSSNTLLSKNEYTHGLVIL